MRVNLLICAVSLILCNACQSASGWEMSKLGATKAEDEAFDTRISTADQLMKENKFSEAIQYLKKSELGLHSPQYGTALRLYRAVGKVPLDPDARITLGLHYMNNFDPKHNIHNFVTKSFYCPEAFYEFKMAIELSPHHRNGEAQQLLSRVKDLQDQAPPDQYHTWDHLRHFYPELLKSRWKPPAKLDYRIAYLSIDPCNVQRARIEVSSGSKKFDKSALDVALKCVDEFPFLTWGLNNACFSFMSDGTSKIVRENRMSIVKFSSLDTPRLSANCDGSPEEEVGRTTVVEKIHLAKNIAIDVPKWHHDKVFSEGQRIRDELFSSIFVWQVLHIDGKDEWVSRQPCKTGLCEQFVAKTLNAPATYKCVLNDQRLVEAVLSEDGLTIQSISVDGKADDVWINAYQLRKENMAEFDRCFVYLIS